MNVFRNSFIVCFVVVLVFLLSSVKTWAYRVSAAESSSGLHFQPDAKRFLDTIWSFENWSGFHYAEGSACTEKQYKRMDMGGRNDCYIDSGDIHYLVGPGATLPDPNYGEDLSAIIFKTRWDPNYGKDSNSLVPSEARAHGAIGSLNGLVFTSPSYLMMTLRTVGPKR